MWTDEKDSGEGGSAGGDGELHEGVGVGSGGVPEEQSRETRPDSQDPVQLPQGQVPHPPRLCPWSSPSSLHALFVLVFVFIGGREPEGEDRVRGRAGDDGVGRGGK